MEHAVIKFGDANGFARRFVVRESSEDPLAVSFSEFEEYVRRVFNLQMSAEIRIKYKKDGDEVVVEEDMGWDEICYSLFNREVLPVDVQIKLPVDPHTNNEMWGQISTPTNTLYLPPPHTIIF